jgi:hypothetical protein
MDQHIDFDLPLDECFEERLYRLLIAYVYREDRNFDRGVDCA